MYPISKTLDEIYDDATTEIIESLEKESELLEKKKEYIDELMKAIANQFVKKINKKEIVGDIKILKSQQYIDFLHDKYIPGKCDNILDFSQLFFNILEISGFLTRADSQKLFDKLIECRNRDLDKGFPKTRLNERGRYSRMNYSKELDEVLEEVIREEDKKVQENSLELEKNWKSLKTVRLVKYGSSQTKFQTASSDVDMTVLTNAYVDERVLLKDCSRVKYGLSIKLK